MDVLLIDDNKEITEMISFFLDSQDISCNVANNGREGLGKIKNEKYDVILLDLTMPEFNGYDIFNDLLKENLLRKNNIVLFTASYISEENTLKMMEEGAKGIIKKPISINQIIETIEKFK
jgi:two-component system, OmpR family, response regulator